MKVIIKRYLVAGAAIVLMSAFTPVLNKFSGAETQSINVNTPGLFSKSNTFKVDFTDLKSSGYSFPLPVGKAKITDNSFVEISTTKGDAVKAMFDGIVRLSRNTPQYGNVIVLRHDNGLETVYGNNAQNIVKVGQRVNAGQTIAIVGAHNGQTFCEFSIMVNGGRINPETIIDIKSHQLRKQIVVCTNNDKTVSIAVEKPKTDEKLLATTDNKAKYTSDEIVAKLNLAGLSKTEWCYPLPGSHVISPYWGKRRHSGVDLKTKPNDNIVAAFDGVVTRAGKYYGYGNCIEINHANGLKTLYGHESKILVKVGEIVKAGQVIGLTGRTGRATTEHLHFEVFFDGKRINPAYVFDHVNKSLQQNTLTYNKGVVRSTKNYYAEKK